MTRCLRWLLLVAAALAAVVAAAAAPPPMRLEPCKLPGVEHPALCGTLSRALDPAAPLGRVIELQVAVLPALARAKLPDPIFFLAGGPGQSAIELAGAAQRLLARLGNRRDIVLVELRGTGRSAPLRCDAADDALRPLRSSVDLATVERDLARCRAALQALPHGDLRRYTTTIAMQDLDAVRVALGVERINLVGLSYGTRAALEYLRLHPQAVRRIVLDGVVPPDLVLPLASALDAQAAFDALLAWCDADAACARAHPQLRRRFGALLASLPREVQVVHPLSGREESLQLTPDMPASLLRAALYSPVLASALPHAIEQAADGRFSALVGLASALGGAGRRGAVAQGLHFSVVCSEDLPLLERAGTPAPAAFGAALTDLYRRVCADWPRGEVSPAFYRVAASPVPVLMLSGAVDPVTPPRHAERMAQALGDRARHLVVPNAGHGVAGLPCLRDLVFRFVDEADEPAALAVDGACVRTLPRPPLFVPPGTGGLR